MIDYKTLSDESAAQAIHARIFAWADLSHTELGLMCVEVRDRLLWRHVTDPVTGQPCGSWTRWLKLFPNKAYSTLHQAVRTVTDLKDVPASDLAEVLQENVGTMVGLSTAVRNDPEVLEAAKTCRNDEFIDMVRATHPDQHLEPRTLLRFRPNESAAKLIEEALRMAEEHGASSREDALELLAVTATEQWRLESEVEDALRAEAGHGN